MKFFISFTFIFCVAVYAEAQPYCLEKPALEWRLWQKNEHFSVSTAKHPSLKVRALQARIVLPTTIEHFYEFLHQEAKVASWLENVSHVSIEKHSKTQSVITSFFDGMLFIRPRVMQAKSTVVKHTEKIMIINVANKPSPIFLPKKTILMTLHFGCWQIKKTSDQTIDVTYQFSASPNGSIPAWLANKVAQKSLWKSLENLQQHFN